MQADRPACAGEPPAERRASGETLAYRKGGALPGAPAKSMRRKHEPRQRRAHISLDIVVGGA